MSDLRIFSYQPNPRIWKATIAARICRVNLEIRGEQPDKLISWLWDFDARPLETGDQILKEGTAHTSRTGFKGKTLYKTKKFMAANPFGTVPVAFSPDGKIGIFESNSIMRAVARIGADVYPLYGKNAYIAARIDSFLDVSLMFARDSQIYLLALHSKKLTKKIYDNARESFQVYAAGIEQTLETEPEYLVDGQLSLADICFACEISLFLRERNSKEYLEQKNLYPVSEDIKTQFPRATHFYEKLSLHPAFSPDVLPYIKKIWHNYGISD